MPNNKKHNNTLVKSARQTMQTANRQKTLKTVVKKSNPKKMRLQAIMKSKMTRPRASVVVRSRRTITYSKALPLQLLRLPLAI